MGMRHLILLLCFALTSCATVKTVDLKTKPQRIELTQPIHVKAREAHPIQGSEFTMPAGVYRLFREDSDKMYYICEGAIISRRWLNPKRHTEVSRDRSGGLLLYKRRGTCWIFSLGSSKDLFEDGMPEMGVIMADKIDGKLVDEVAVLGRVDESWKLVPLGNDFLGKPDALDGVVLAEPAPFMK